MSDADPGSVPTRAEVKVGRNESCWCGSGRKYKKCHLAADEQRAVEETTVDLDPSGLDLDH